MHFTDLGEGKYPAPSHSSHQFSSVAQSYLTLCDPMDCSMPGLPVHHQLPNSAKPMCIESVMPFSHLLLCHPLLLLPPIPPSIRVFSNESTLCMRWPKYWSFSFSMKESSPTPQFKSINSLALSFLHNPTLTSIHDHWKNHSLD